jgi:aromatic ring-cleaving dioxygenase
MKIFSVLFLSFFAFVNACREPFVTFNNNCYHYNKHYFQVSTESAKFCKQWGMILAEPRDGETLDFLINMVGNDTEKDPSMYHIWLGINKEDGGFRYVTDKEMIPGQFLTI